MSLKYRIALTVFLLEAVMMTAILWQFGSTSPDQIQHEVFARTIVIAAIGMSLIALAGITIGFLLTRRLERLTGAAARLAAGETEVRVGFTGGDEVARLGRSFDTMADRIGSTLSALKSSEARNRVLVEYCPAAIFVFDPVAFRLVDV
ncbi:MAG: HAMP domain-containing protein, partial [Nevskiales bacterium]